MRFEGKSEQEAIETALKDLKRPASELRYHVIRDEKSFWGGRVVEIEVEIEGGAAREAAPAPADAIAAAPAASSSSAVREIPPPPAKSSYAAVPTPAPVPALVPPAAPAAPSDAGAGGRSGSAGPGAMDDDAFAAAEATLTELLGAAGFLVETRRRPAADEMLFELIGDDVEPLLANRGEGLNGLEVLTGRIASKRVGRPVYPRLDAEGFRAHQRESLEELALRSANEAKRTKSPQLLPPLSPGERRLVHLALAKDPDVETESEGDGFLKRVAVRPRAS
jgi:spoIIIJ-associated protein